MNTAVILNSAQGKYVRGADSWVEGTLRAVEHLAKRRDTVLVASVSLPSWELPACLAAARKVELALILPGSDSGAGNRYFLSVVEALGLDPSRTRPVFTGENSPGSFLSVRDRLAVELADTVYPVSTRPGGRLESLLSEAAAGGKDVRRDFLVRWQRKHWRPFYDFSKFSLNPRINELTRDRLTHWTHSWQGPWPGERPREFYRDLLARPETYVRSAGESLARIAAEKLIRASSWKMPGGEPAVGFTALPAGRCIELMTWRRSLARYSFEPFGVAVRTAELVRLGCRPVKYFAESSTRPAGPDLPFTQGEGKTAAWSREEEWRTRGDLNLAGLDAESVLLLACTREDAAYINSKCRPPWPIVHLFE